MTGKHPVRVDITDWIPGQPPTNPSSPEDRHSCHSRKSPLPRHSSSMATRLSSPANGTWARKANGQPTRALTSTSAAHRARPPADTTRRGPIALKAKRKTEYLTERLTEESAKFLESRDKAKPFLLYLSYYNIHTPIQPYKKRIDHYKSKPKNRSPAPPRSKWNTTEKPGRDRTTLPSPQWSRPSMTTSAHCSINSRNLSWTTTRWLFSATTAAQHAWPHRPRLQSAAPGRQRLLYEGGIREPRSSAPRYHPTRQRVAQANDQHGFFPRCSTSPGSLSTQAARRRPQPVSQLKGNDSGQRTSLALPPLPRFLLETGRLDS